MDLNGQHAVVTGGGTGIGLAIARALADAGATVTITGRRLGVLEAAAQDRIIPLQMDVTDEGSVRDGMAAAATARGPIRICVANAGIADGAPFDKVTLAEWRAMMASHLDGAFLSLQAALASLPDRSGRMIVVSSIAGVKGLPKAVPYTVAKHGMVGLMRGLAVEYAGTDLTFNAICPGYVETDMMTQQIPGVMRRRGIDEEAARDIFAQGNAHGRILQVDEIAGAALWLCSDTARSVNGQTIEIFGGQV